MFRLLKSRPIGFLVVQCAVLGDLHSKTTYRELLRVCGHDGTQVLMCSIRLVTKILHSLKQKREDIHSKGEE